MPEKKINKIYSPHILAVLFFGFSAGLPIALTGGTLQAWFTADGVSLMSVGALTLVGLPYIWKFLWAPVMDSVVPPWLGRRRGWIAITQLSLCVALFLLANMSPKLQPVMMGLMAFLIAFFSASQDTAVDAYRTDTLLPEERGLGSASYIFGYRMAMLFAGGLALILADRIGWRVTYELMAVLLGLSVIATYFAPESKKIIAVPTDFTSAVIEPFKNLLQRDSIILVLLFVLLYKIGDALAQALLSNFLLRGLGFSLTDVGFAYKTVSIIATIGGAFIGGALLIRINLYRALLIFGLAQASANLTLMLLASVGKNYFVMVLAIFTENFCNGMGTIAFMAFLMSVCDTRYSATQYACLAALSAVGRVFLGPVAAIMVRHLGWTSFFGWTFIICFPGLILLGLLRSRVRFNAEAIEY